MADRAGCHCIMLSLLFFWCCCCIYYYELSSVAISRFRVGYNFHWPFDNSIRGILQSWLKSRTQPKRSDHSRRTRKVIMFAWWTLLFSLFLYPFHSRPKNALKWASRRINGHYANVNFIYYYTRVHKLSKYSGQNLLLALPREITSKQVRWLSLWSNTFRVISRRAGVPIHSAIILTRPGVALFIRSPSFRPALVMFWCFIKYKYPIKLNWACYLLPKI